MIKRIIKGMRIPAAMAPPLPLAPSTKPDIDKKKKEEEKNNISN